MFKADVPWDARTHISYLGPCYFEVMIVSINQDIGRRPPIAVMAVRRSCEILVAASHLCHKHQKWVPKGWTINMCGCLLACLDLDLSSRGSTRHTVCQVQQIRMAQRQARQLRLAC